MNEELKPCPFCPPGEPVELECNGHCDTSPTGVEWWVRCRNDDCPIDIPLGWPTKEAAVAVWNTRPVEDALRAKWDAVPWDAIISLQQRALDFDLTEDDTILDEWLAANAQGEQA